MLNLFFIIVGMNFFGSIPMALLESAQAGWGFGIEDSDSNRNAYFYTIYRNIVFIFCREPVEFMA